MAIRQRRYRTTEAHLAVDRMEIPVVHGARARPPAAASGAGRRVRAGESRLGGAFRRRFGLQRRAGVDKSQCQSNRGSGMGKISGIRRAGGA